MSDLEIPQQMTLIIASDMTNGNKKASQALQVPSNQTVTSQQTDGYFKVIQHYPLSRSSWTDIIFVHHFNRSWDEVFQSHDMSMCPTRTRMGGFDSRDYAVRLDSSG